MLCLEEMFKVKIENGQFYYLQEHRRRSETIDNQLREKTINLIRQIMMICETGKTAAAKYKKRKCDNCSMMDLCMPKSTGLKYKPVKQFMETQLGLTEKIHAETS